jgi:stage III sporulation protein SpoIIIAA
MAKGKLKCIGSSLYLKTKYGEGHRITLNVDKKKIQVMMETIKKFFPSAVMVDYKGGNLIVGIS